MPAGHLDEEGIQFAYLMNSRLTVDQFFELIAYDLDLNCPSDSKSQVLLSLQQMLLQQAGQGRHHRPDRRRGP